MNPDVRRAHVARDADVGPGRRRGREFRVRGVRLQRRGANECVRNRVLSRIAVLETSRSVVSCARDELVAVSRESVVMLRMIVIAVGVRMQQRRPAGRRDQRRDEQ